MAGNELRNASVLLALATGLLMANGALTLSRGSGLLALLGLAAASASAAAVLLAFGMKAVRGRNPIIALGMVGTFTGLGGALFAALTNEYGILLSASAICAMLSAAAYGLSFPKPRPPMAVGALAAFAASALALVLTTPIDRFAPAVAGAPFLVAAAGWALYAWRTATAGANR